jgi:hypothetical protein
MTSDVLNEKKKAKLNRELANNELFHPVTLVTVND